MMKGKSGPRTYTWNDILHVQKIAPVHPNQHRLTDLVLLLAADRKTDSWKIKGTPWMFS